MVYLSGEQQPHEALRKGLPAWDGAGQQLLNLRDAVAAEVDALVGVQQRGLPEQALQKDQGSSRAPVPCPSDTWLHTRLWCTDFSSALLNASLQSQSQSGTQSRQILAHWQISTSRSQEREGAYRDATHAANHHVDIDFPELGTAMFLLDPL